MTRSARSVRLMAQELEARDVPATAFALTQVTNNLLRFDTATPGTIQATIPVTGLVAGDVLVGTDFRPADGLLYGLGVNDGANTLQLYRIDPTGGAATTIGGPITLPAGNTIATATFWGVDFNPAADRLRVVNNLTSDGAGNNANNLRINPNTGTLVAIDPDLDFTGLPAGSAPEVAVAYTNSQAGTQPGGTTTLFGIVSGTDLLVTHTTAPGFQTLNQVGALGVNTSDLTGLDIFGPNANNPNTAFAILTTGGVPQLHSINLGTGAATLVGTVGDGTVQLTDISIAPPPLPVAVGGSTNGQVQLQVPGVGGQLAAGATVNAFQNVAVNVRSTTADVDGDGIADIISITGPGTAVRLNVISGADNTTVLVQPFDPFGDPSFTGGGFVTAGFINADNRAEFVATPDQGGGPRVVIFNRNPDGSVGTLASFLGIDDPNFRGGARGSLGDVNGDGIPELAVAAGFLGGPRVALFNGTTLLGGSPTRLINDFFAFPGSDATTLRNGSFVTISDINGDGFGDLAFGGGPGGAPRVFILSGQLMQAGDVAGAQNAPIANFFVNNNQNDRGGVRVSFADLDGDNRGDLVVGSGEGRPAGIRAYRGINFTTTGEPAQFQDAAVFGAQVLANGVFVG